MILGIALFIIGSSISSRVSEGQRQLDSAQEGVNIGRGLSDLNPYTSEVGNVVADAAQSKIDQHRQEAGRYQTAATWLHTLGIILFASGLALLLYTLRR